VANCGGTTSPKPEPWLWISKFPLANPWRQGCSSARQKHGGHGFFDVGEDLLFIGLGISGGRPPRFASDCGYFFSFERDENFELPDVPVWSRSEVYSSELGAIVWHPNANEWRGDVILSDSTRCEIWVSDYLIPIHRFITKIENVYGWLRDNLTEVKSICGERVEEWIDEDEELSQLGSDEVSATISINSISASNGDIHLWASTSIPIDHSIRVHLDIDNHHIRAIGASIEG